MADNEYKINQPKREPQAGDGKQIDGAFLHLKPAIKLAVTGNLNACSAEEQGMALENKRNVGNLRLAAGH
jgi:hypothetical protein